MTYVDDLKRLRPRAADTLPMLPEHMHDAVALWITRGIPPGSFLTAVLSNDLSGAFGYADDINRHAMFEWVSFLHNYAPAQCWGSPETVKAWAKAGGLCGMDRASDTAVKVREL